MLWHTEYVARLTTFIRIWLYAVYPAIKLVAYVAWCRWGAAHLDCKPGRSSLADGAVRFVIGVAFGGAAYMAALAFGGDKLSWLYDRVPPYAVYTAVFIPIRWVEWWIMERFMARRPDPLLSATPRALRWRVEGILISFVSDVPLFLLVDFLGAIA